MTIVGALLAALIGWGCTHAQDTPLRVGTHIWPGFEPLYLAREQGHYPRRSIRLVEYTTGSDVIRAFQAGAIDAAALTLDEALFMAESRPEVVVVLVLDTSVGGDAVLARPELSDMRALKGKRVGLETTALGAYVLTRALETVGLTPADVKVVPIETLEHEPAFRKGRVDAVVTYEPFRTKLLALGARQVFDSSQIPGEILDVVVVRRSALEAHRERIDQLVRGWFEALESLEADRPRAIAVMAKREGLSAAEFERALHGLRFYDRAQNRDLLAGSAPALLPTARRVGAIMVGGRLLEREPTLSGFLDGRFVAEVAP